MKQAWSSRLKRLGRWPMSSTPSFMWTPSSLWGGGSSGPSGTRIAVRCGRSPSPLGYGGAQERGLRPGTQDAGLAAGFAAAVGGIDELRLGFGSCAALRDQLEARILAYGGAVHGSGPRLPHVSNFRLPGWKGDELVAALDLEGVSVSAGSACSAGTVELSPAILAMLGRVAAEGAIRVSLGPGADETDLGRLLGAIERLCGRPSHG
jgi:cysteine desulfurase